MNDVTKDLLEAMLIVARMAEDLKKPCGMDPESPQAIRNAQYMNISYAARAAITRAEAAPQPGRPTMAVWFGEMPESNWKMNWTAILYRRDGSLMDGVTIYRSEYKDRVRYEADRLRWLIGELEHKPNILAYDAELIAEAAPAEHDEQFPCRNALARDGKPYPKSNCQRCGTLMRPGWKCAEGVELGRPSMRGCELRDDAVGVFKP